MLSISGEEEREQGAADAAGGDAGLMPGVGDLDGATRFWRGVVTLGRRGCGVRGRVVPRGRKSRGEAWLRECLARGGAVRGGGAVGVPCPRWCPAGRWGVGSVSPRWRRAGRWGVGIVSPRWCRTGCGCGSASPKVAPRGEVRRRLSGLDGARRFRWACGRVPGLCGRSGVVQGGLWSCGERGCLAWRVPGGRWRCGRGWLAGIAPAGFAERAGLGARDRLTGTVSCGVGVVVRGGAAAVVPAEVARAGLAGRAGSPPRRCHAGWLWSYGECGCGGPAHRWCRRSCRAAGWPGRPGRVVRGRYRCNGPVRSRGPVRCAGWAAAAEVGAGVVVRGDATAVAQRGWCREGAAPPRFGPPSAREAAEAATRVR